MYPGLRLGSTKDWSYYNDMDNNIYGQMKDGRNQHNSAVNIQGGHMDIGRNRHQLPFSQHDPMVNVSRNKAQQMGFTQHGLAMGGGTRIATHNAGSWPRMSRMGSGGSLGLPDR
jgi:hypothetical protein